MIFASTEDHTWDVVYQDDSKAWACCNDADCNHPLPGNKDLGEPFDAPSTADLLPYFTVPLGGHQPTIPPSSSSSQSSSMEPAPTGSSLSAGSSAGIGIGVGLGVALVLVSAGFWLLRRRQSKEPLPEQDKGVRQQQQAWEGYSGASTGDSRGYVGLQELEITNVSPRELQA